MIKTQTDIYALLDDYENKKISKGEFVATMFLALAKIRSEAYCNGWDSRDKLRDGYKARVVK